eukprot:TRINITY_DN121266_c0_g1_i1.p2 TRINITY_DN121266_c0_g1~~TRINITY_DN121266_c0_g1_i1.p2  ORF type:complete len:378 (+),score=139.72 TRINITY_DN121266_c0_g1_i1:79-1212(+)
MQFKKIAALALLAAVPTDAATLQTTASASFARTWLRAHGAPNSDELAELKTANPEAYAIVKALLTKRSLGLLDPRHPTASFAKQAAPAADSDASAAAGSEAFQLSEQDRQVMVAKKGGAGEADAADQNVAMPYATVGAAPAHHDWMNWKPQDSAMDDEAMVKGVLGEVAQLKMGGAAPVQPPALATNTHNTGSALEADEAAFGGKLGVDVAVAQEEEKEAKSTKTAAKKPADDVVADVPAAGGNSYLNAVDLGADVQSKPVHRASAIQGNSYLRGLDLGENSDSSSASATATAASAKDSTGVNYLASFSWGDDAKPQTTKPPAAQVQPKKKAAGLNVLSSWLNLGGGAVQESAPRAQPVAAQQAPAAAAGNPYLVNW